MSIAKPRIFKEEISSDNSKKECEQIKLIKEKLENFECLEIPSCYEWRISKEVKKNIIERLQEKLLMELRLFIPTFSWGEEYIEIDSCMERYDIYGKPNFPEDISFSVVIELDSARADQVAKKFLFRTANTVDSNLLYITLCYPGTRKSDLGECEKSIKYCAGISQSLSYKRKKNYLAFFIR